MTPTRTAALRRTPMRTRHRDTGPDRATRELVKDRTNGMCSLGCGRAGTDIQHRDPRGAGGSKNPRKNRPSNLIWICRTCHHWIEVESRAEAYEAGLLIRGDRDPRLVPLRAPGGSVYLRDDGSVSPFPPGEENAL